MTCSRWKTIVIFVALLLFLQTLTALAGYAPHGGIICSEPTALSEQGPDTFALIPRIAADTTGRLHLIWSGGTTDQYPDTDAIFYSSFQGGQWSTPVDILASSNYASADALVLTPDNHLVVSWTFRGTEGVGLRVSRAGVESVGSAQGWQTTPISAAPVRDSSLFVDSAGRIHLGFIIHDPAMGTGHLGYARSQDNGETWSPPVDLASFDPVSITPRFVTIYADGANSVEMAWSISARADDWSPINIVRAVSTDDGSTWADPEEVFPGPRANMPSYLQSADPNRVYLTWVRGVGYGDSKYAQTSTDSGATWSAPQLIISEKRGMNGPMRMAVDSQGGEYLVLSGDESPIGTRIWVSRKAAGGSWSAPVPISGTDLHESEFPQAAIRNGNELHVFWLDWGQKEVFSAVCSLDVPAVLPSSSDPSQAPIPEFTPTSVTEAVQTPLPGAQSTVEPTQPAPSSFRSEATNPPSTSSVLVLSILAPLLLVGVVVGWQLFGGGRRRR